MSIRYGREFFKMTGSGNDFVFIDAMAEPAGDLADTGRIRSLCVRGTGVGADGMVFLEPSEAADLAIRYYNSDGSRASLCGNASLCAARLAAELGIAAAEALSFATDAGVIRGRVRQGVPEIDLQAVADVEVELDLALRAGERRLGYALAGVPHVVVLCNAAESADVVERGRELRWNAAFAQGANVNFVSDEGGRFAIRTFERGVEAETLACGTGSVATAVLLAAWGVAAGPEVELQTRSGQAVVVTLPVAPGTSGPSLRGEGRLVYRARLAEA